MKRELLIIQKIVINTIGLVKTVFDVSGAGDTVVSVLATCINQNKDILDAVNYANLSAGYVVTLKGTQPITHEKFLEIIN